MSPFRVPLALALGLAVGFAVGFHTKGSADSGALRPIDGWTAHQDVTLHFPHHPAVLAHHWCKKINARLTECQLYDADGPHANLVGIEPIVSDAIYHTFSAAEQRYWHWHKTSKARIVVPGGSATATEAANRRRGSSHGKTILIWDPLDTRDPIGPPFVAPH